PARDRHRLPDSDQQHASPLAQAQNRDLLHDRHRLPQLYGLGTSHVRKRNESVLVADVLFPDLDHHDPRHDHDSHLARQPLWLALTYHRSIAVRARFHFDVCQWRRQRFLPRPALYRHLPACHLLRRRTLSHGDGSRRDLRDLRGHLLLVPKDDRSHDERVSRQAAFLAYLHWDLLHLHALPLSRTGRKCPPLFGFRR